MAKAWDRGLLVIGLALMAIAVPVGIVLAAHPGAGGRPVVGWAGPAGTGSAAGPSTSANRSPTPTPTALASTTRPPVPVPPKRTSGKPGGSNTGVPAGVALTVVTGDQTYSRAGQVVNGLDVHGFVRITAHNVVIKNSIIRGGTPRCNSAVLFITDSGSATVEDSEIAPSHPSPCLDGVWATNTTLLRMDIHGAVDGVKAFDHVTLQDSYIHDLSRFASDPNQGGGPTHNDAVQTYEGNQHIFLRHNNLTVGSQANAAYQVSQDGGQPMSDVHIENNWLDGGGCTLNFAHKTLASMTGIYVVGNRFGRHSFFGCPILVSTKTTLSQNSGNVWDDTGAPIPPPDRHD